jgi:hypothetical protein
MIQGTHAILRLISLHLRGEMSSFLISTSIPYLAKDESKDDRYRTSRTVYDSTSQPYNDFYFAGAGCHRSVEYFSRRLTQQSPMASDVNSQGDTGQL